MEPAFNLPLVGLLTAAIATPVQVLVSLSRIFWPKLPGKYLPLIGIGAGLGTSLVSLVGMGVAFNPQSVAQSVLAAIGGQIGAMAAVALHEKATKVDEKIQAALDSPPGTTREEVDQIVKLQEK